MVAQIILLFPAYKDIKKFKAKLLFLKITFKIFV